MPQLDFSTYASQAFWLFVCFCALWFLLAFFVMPKLANVQEQRKRKINDYVQKAENLNAQAKDSLYKYQNTLAKAEAMAENELEKGRENIKRKLQETYRKMSDELNDKLADNEFMLAKEKNMTMAKADKISLNVAHSIVQKLGFAEVKLSDIEQLANEDLSHE